MKIKTTSRKVSRVSAGRMGENPDGSPDGLVVTDHGYVLVCAWGDWLRLTFVWRGREYTRTIDRPGRHWTAQGIVRPAKEFAAEISNE